MSAPRSASADTYHYPDTVATEAVSRQIVRTQNALQLRTLARHMANYAKTHVRRGHAEAAKAFAQRAARYAAASVRKQPAAQKGEGE